MGDRDVLGMKFRYTVCKKNTTTKPMKNLVNKPVFLVLSIVTPQPGHSTASDRTRRPHSIHFSIAILGLNKIFNINKHPKRDGNTQSIAPQIGVIKKLILIENRCMNG